VAAQSGPAFKARWRGGTLGDLFSLISQTMPQNAAGSLPKADYAAIIAFMLRETGYPAGTAELPASAEALAKVRLPPD
jgi:hypothetical protein